MKTRIKFAALFLLSFSGVASADKSVSLDELRKHNTEVDCWMAIDGSVYDMTPYIKLHGELCKEMKLTEHCGSDASAVWKAKESGKAPHKKNSERELLKAKLGRFSA